MSAKQLADTSPTPHKQVEKAMRTTIPLKSAVIATCDLLEKSYFCSIANNFGLALIIFFC